MPRGSRRSLSTTIIRTRGRSTRRLCRSMIRCSAITWRTACLPKTWRGWKRPSADLRARLEDVRSNREDFQLHTLGSIWHRTRLTCPSRQQLGSYLLDALDPELAAYIKFHIDVVECPYCQANFADLKRRQSGPPSATTTGRRDRIFKVVQDLLSEDRRGS